MVFGDFTASSVGKFLTILISFSIFGVAFKIVACSRAWFIAHGDLVAIEVVLNFISKSCAIYAICVGNAVEFQITHNGSVRHFYLNVFVELGELAGLCSVCWAYLDGVFLVVGSFGSIRAICANKFG